MDTGDISTRSSTNADAATAASLAFLHAPELHASEPPVPGSPLPGPFPRPPTVDPSDPLKPVIPPVEEPEPDDPDNDRPQPNPDEIEPEKRVLIA